MDEWKKNYAASDIAPTRWRDYVAASGWKKPLYEDGKTPDKGAVDEAADTPLTDLGM